MSFTFLGYIHIPPVSITTAYIPILIAACLLKPAQTTILGLVFGLASMYKATAYYVMPFDQLFSPFLSGAPLKSFLLSVGTRTLFGFLIGFIFAYIRKKPRFPLWSGVLAALAPKIHGLLVYLAIGYLFPEQKSTLNTTLHMNWEDLLVSLLCICIVELVQKLRTIVSVQNFKQSIEQIRNIPSESNKVYKAWFITIFATLVITIISTVYFAQRMSYMLETHGIEITSIIEHDLLHLQIQFVAAMLSLSVIIGIILVMVYQYVSYQQYLGKLDDLTGLIGRKMFFSYCEMLLQQPDIEASKEGYFIFLDIDHFKSINDTFGHPVGDQVIQNVADKIRHNFSSYGTAGRVGGDEFVIFLLSPLSNSEIRELLDQFQADVSTILPQYGKLSCSIGVSHFTHAPKMQEIFIRTDSYLYEAKQQGKARYVIHEY